ncbi:hypothetical protein CEXT_569321, partial [Caerostris extrusa]
GNYSDILSEDSHLAIRGIFSGGQDH